MTRPKLPPEKARVVRAVLSDPQTREYIIRSMTDRLALVFAAAILAGAFAGAAVTCVAMWAFLP